MTLFCLKKKFSTPCLRLGITISKLKTYVVPKELKECSIKSGSKTNKKLWALKLPNWSKRSLMLARSNLKNVLTLMRI
jgi:ABC-type proline/glycine betaine transport system permease subunit